MNDEQGQTESRGAVTSRPVHFLSDEHLASLEAEARSAGGIPVASDTLLALIKSHRENVGFRNAFEILAVAMEQAERALGD